MSDLPEIKDELRLKTIDTIQTLVSKRELGQITNAEYAIAIKTIFNICSGLVEKDFMEIIMKAYAELEKDYSFSRTRLFRKDNVVSAMHITNDKSSFSALTLTCKIVGEKLIEGDRDELHTNAEVEEKIVKQIAKYKALGMVEI